MTDNVQILAPTGDPNLDMPAIREKVARVRAHGGYIQIVDLGKPLALNGFVEMADVSLIGEQRARISLTPASGLIFGSYINPNAGGEPLPGGFPSGSNRITIPPGMVLAPGDIVAIRSNDSLNSLIQPATPTGATWPLDFFRVNWVAGGKAYLDGCSVDDMFTSLMIAKQAMAKGVRCENIEFISGEPAADITTAAVTAYQCDDFVARNLRLNGMSKISTHSCYGSLIDQCVADPRTVVVGSDFYGFVTGVGAHQTIKDCVAYNGSGCFTTGGSDVGNGVRYGTGRGVRYIRCKALGGGNGYGSSSPFTLHAETYAPVYESCEVHVGPIAGTSDCYAFSTACRGAQYFRCKVFGDRGTFGFNVLGRDTVIDNCLVQRAFNGVTLQQQVTNPTVQNDRLSVSNCTFREIRGPGIIVNGGKGHYFIGNRFPDCGGHAIGNPDWMAAKIHFDNPGGSIVLGGKVAGERIVIRNNDLDKAHSGDTFSIYQHTLDDTTFDLSGNSMRGYGPGSLGTMPHRRWKASTLYAVHDVIRIVRSPTSIGLLICRLAGTSGTREPSRAGTDGTAVWAEYYWMPKTEYAVGNRVRLAITGVLSCRVGGKSGSVEPIGDVLDGTVRWSQIAWSDNPLQLRFGTKNYTD